MAMSLTLIFVDHRYDALDSVRYGLGAIVSPIQYIADWPASISGWASGRLSTRESIQEDNSRLRNQLLLLQRRTQKLAALAAENMRLRELLNSSSLVDDNVIVSEIIGVDSDPYRHHIILNKGKSDGVVKGQAVLDAMGLMGQITEVWPFSSSALLISDTSHAIPVQVNRNGVRAIAVGSGELDKLHLIHMPDTADVMEGDLLVSSGLGGRFPFGYPVAEVSFVRHDPGQPFAIVEAKPKSKLDRSRHVLVVLKGDANFNFEVDNDQLNSGDVAPSDLPSENGVVSDE